MRGVFLFSKTCLKKSILSWNFSKHHGPPTNNNFETTLRTPSPRFVSLVPLSSKWNANSFFFQFQWNSILWGNAISLKCWVHAGGQTFWTEKLKLKLKEKEKEKILLIKIEIDDAKEFCDSDVFLKKLIYQRYFNW